MPGNGSVGGSPPPLIVTPEIGIVTLESPLEIKCKSTIPITHCRFSIPGVEESLSLRPGLPPHEGLEYVGEGLEKGDCGLIIPKVFSKHIGYVNCSVGYSRYATESTGQIEIFIAKPPSTPNLTVTPDGPVKEGEVIYAVCTVENGYPAANLTYSLGSEILTDNVDPPEIENKSDATVTVRQKYQRKVTDEDHGKDLKCSASHMALTAKHISHSIYKLDVQFPPKPKSKEIEQFGFSIGSPARIAVTVRANPTPNIYWKIGSEKLYVGAKDKTGRYEAQVLKSKGNGVWEAVLFIAVLKLEDMDKSFTLHAENPLGYEKYKIAISTNFDGSPGLTSIIVGIIIALLLLILLIFILIFARVTRRWCFRGKVPKPPGESLLPLRWPRNKKIDRNPKKVNSLIYKDYVLVEHKNGSKSYVSPEEKAQLLLDGKIKSEKSKVPEKSNLKLKLLDSDSEEGYEIPVTPQKPKSCENLETCPKPEIKRNSSFPEMSPGENGRINLPPFIVPVETSLTYPMTKMKNKEKRKAKENGNKYEISPCLDPEELRRKDSDDDVDLKKRFSLRPSMSLWSKNKNKDINYSEKDALKPRFSLPWSKTKEREEKKSPPENRNERKSFSMKLPKMSWGRGKKEKLGVDEVDLTNPQEVEPTDKGLPEKELEEDTQEPFRRRDVYRDTDNDDNEVLVVVEEPKEIYPNHLAERLTKTANPETLEFDSKSKESDEDEEVIYRPKPPDWSTFPLNNEFINKEEGELSKSEDSLPGVDRSKESSMKDTSDETDEEKLPELPDWSTFPLAQGIKNIDRNPLAQYFKSKQLSSDEEDHDEPIRISIVDDRTTRPRNSAEFPQKYKPMKKINTNPLKNIFSHNKRNGRRTDTKTLENDDDDDDDDDDDENNKHNDDDDCKSEDTSFSVGIYPSEARTKFGASGEVDNDPDSACSGAGSDTESADHGSADKSSMSKLTSEKQPKKLMGGLFGSFKLSKNKDKVADNDITKNPTSFEITIKPEPCDDEQTEVPNSERIVYAELDMARSPGNVMRRDDEKTEYAEIIYPGSKTTAEKAMEELRKSRENLASSRENLTEVDEAYTTVTTPDGKKEAAV